ncbi:MAG TPA: sigma 54-interacting transcriptional regulator [Paucimonas sp.]|nr:sigma 54-interacting transcriptional regulator [Paucimonas sp.]
MDSDSTLSSPLPALGKASRPMLGLTILWHPDLDRVGQQCIALTGDGEIGLGRFAPLFSHPGAEALPLGDQAISRSPVWIRRHADDAVEIACPASRMPVRLGGAAIEGTVRLHGDDIGRGAVLGLGANVLLCLHWMRCLPKANALPGLLGVSSAAIEVRDLVRQVAATDLPVLLLGETGTGKDVAARLIHATGDRKNEPMVAVNMATLNESLAAADLFGATRGAYTGAQTERRGLFAEADGGTLFLDEIGDTPATVQPMLLRVLETGEYRPLGARGNLVSSARLIAATDQDLVARSFNRALLRRMEAFVIRMPSLRERREDIGVLLLHFLRTWSGSAAEMAVPPIDFIGEICNNDWPGNVRQLAHVVRRAVMALRISEAPVLSELMRGSTGEEAQAARAATMPYAVNAGAAMTRTPGSASGADPVRRAKPADLSDEMISLAMENSAWKISSAAQQLGISRPSLYKLLETHPEIRWPETIAAHEIRRVLEELDGDLGACAAKLKTPREALRRHLRSIGMDGLLR